MTRSPRIGPHSPLFIYHLLVNRTRPRRRLRRDRAVRNPNINQRLHRLHVPFTQQPKQHRHVDKMHKARIQVCPPATGLIAPHLDVPEGLDEMRVVDVRVQPEHLPEDRLDVRDEVLGEAGAFANPVMPGERGEWERRGGGPSSDGRVGAWGVEPAGSIFGRGMGERVGGENAGVAELAADPALHHAGVLGRGDTDGLFLMVEPGVSVGAVGG